MSDKQCSNIAEFLAKASTNGGKAFGYLEVKINEVAVRDVNKKDGTSSKVHTLTVEDATGTITVDLWDSTIDWKAGDVFCGTNLYTKEYKGIVGLSAAKTSKISKKMASGSKAAAAKPAATKAAATGSTAAGTSALEKKIENMKGEILNAITEMKVVLLDQMKEFIIAQTGPPAEGTDETQPPGEETTDEAAGQEGSQDAQQ